MAAFPDRASFSSRATADFSSLVGEVGDEFLGCLREHGRLGTGFMILVDEAVDSSLAYVLVYAPLVDNAP